MKIFTVNSIRWHQDVKPTNILVSTRNGKSVYECEFKLADLGLSHFSTRRGENVEGRDTQGTRTYGKLLLNLSQPLS